MKWSRAVHHVEELALACADMATRPVSIFPLRVVELWAVGDVLGSPRELDVVTVALSVDLPVGDVPWLDEPVGAEHWSYATRLAKNPVEALWRSAHAPVWNHRIHRPALVWDSTRGVAEDALAALRAGEGERVRLPAPTRDDLRIRIEDELMISRRALRARTREYEARRWAPGKITPLADALWRAANGYFDLEDADL